MPKSNLSELDRVCLGEELDMLHKKSKDLTREDLVNMMASIATRYNIHISYVSRTLAILENLKSNKKDKLTIKDKIKRLFGVQ